jgi:alpha-glucosidase
MKKITAIVLLMACISGFSANTDTSGKISVSSPDGKIVVNVKLTDRIYYNLEVDGTQVMWYSPVSLKTKEAGQLGMNPVLTESLSASRDGIIPTVWGIRKEIVEKYHEMNLSFEGGYSLIFRVYDDGMAYRWNTGMKGSLTVQEEESEFRFLDNHRVIAHVVGDFQTSYEKTYSRMTIGDMKEKEFASLPFVVDYGALKLLITESDLFDYPGMYITHPEGNNRNYLKGIFPAYPKSWTQSGWGQFNLRVTERENFLAKTTGTRFFPWRTIIVARHDYELTANDMVYRLARPSAIETSWIRPGKVSWDWWNDWNLEGVDFTTGINNKTYEYYIDFAAKNGIEYIIMDEGWSDQFDVLLPSPFVDMEHLTRYAREKGVGIILWTVWHTIDRQMEDAFALFEKWGIAGVKVDFIDRDDQVAIEFYERLAREAAKHKLLVDYHGCSKPTGLYRTYPNVINFEAVRGNEYNKFNKDETPGHNVDIAYTRMVAGPMDYTPGAMRNSIQGDFITSNSNPMSYGTRCHQLGMYVVYFAPLQMLCDAPTAYEREPQILSFLSSVPVTWDETIALDGKLGEYVVIARRKGNDWYLGGLTDWNERTVEIDLSRFCTGEYSAKLWLDGINANKMASDYQVVTRKISSSDSLKITMKKGGGFAARLEKL